MYTTSLTEERLISIDLNGSFRKLGAALVVFGLGSILLDTLFVHRDLLAVAPMVLLSGAALLLQALHAKRIGYPNLWDLGSGLVYVALGILLLYSPLLLLSGTTVATCSALLILTALKAGQSFSYELPGQKLFLFAAGFDLMIFLFIGSAWSRAGLHLLSLFIGCELVFYGICWIARSTHYVFADRIATRT